MFKRGLLRIAGVVAYVAPPIAYLATKYQLFISKEASVTLSAYGVLAIIPILTLLGYYLKKIPLKIPLFGLLMCVFGIMGMYIGEVLAWVGGLTAIGGVAGQMAFKTADKLKDKQKDNDFAKIIVSNLTKEKN